MHTRNIKSCSIHNIIILLNYRFSTLVYYLMAASTGVEVANFNLAYLCEEDNVGFVDFV